MAYFFTLLYAALTYLSPDEFFPLLAPYRIVLAAGILTIVVSLPAILLNLKVLQFRQAYLLMALVMAIVFSHVVHAWFGGALLALEDFMPSVILFLSIVVNVTTWRRLQGFTLLMVVIALYMLIEALSALYLGKENSIYVFHQNIFKGDQLIEVVLRIRGAGRLHDPNDFAQYLLTTLPFVWLAWRKGSKLRNILVVLIPSAVILFGIYQTHSRGALLGVLVMVIVSGRRRLGLAGSGLTAALLFAVLLALNFAGDRGISMNEGAGRLEAWSTGLAMLKASPIIGVGYGSFLAFHEITAHNSFVLCFSELGLVGYFLWLALLTTTMLDLSELVNSNEVEGRLQPSTAPVSAAVEENNETRTDLPGMAHPAFEAAGPDKQEFTMANIQRWAKAVQLALYCFLATAWFLSRTYAAGLYVLLALAVVLQNFA